MPPPPPTSTLFPYTTLFRSLDDPTEITIAAHIEQGKPHDSIAIDPPVREECVAIECSERSEEHTSELQSPCNLVCRLLLEKKKNSTVQDTADRESGDTSEAR